MIIIEPSNLRGGGGKLYAETQKSYPYKTHL